MISKLLKEINSHLKSIDKKNEKVSRSSVGWQLDHCTRTMCTIGKALIKSEPQTFKRTFAWKWLIISGLQYIPRGKGRAPKIAVNPNEITAEELKTLIQNAESIWKKVEQLDKNAFFAHPYFGNLNKRQAKKFVKIHTRHHLKIVRDILKD
ncbi:MAG: DUF1569 domain-containing protein [Bacteroidota bacterium]